MSDYLLIQSQDPFESSAVLRDYELAGDLAAAGNKVTLFLVQNGTLAGRQGSTNAALTALAGKGVDVLADEFSLRERAIPADSLADGVKAASLETAFDQFAAGTKTIWL
ncbi:MAG: DsrE family protein [Planctomycetota bacterium]